MQMKMVIELLIPCVQDTYKAQLAAQLVFAKAQQRLRDSFEQKRQHDGFVIQGNDVQFVGQCKDDVKVADWKQLLFAGLDPSFSGYLLAFRAMPVAAGMIDNAFGAAVTAALDMAP
jgi:hypothetical protein